MNCEIEMTLNKECKGSVRYSVPESEDDGRQATTNVYIRKSALPTPYPEKVTVTIVA